MVRILYTIVWLMILLNTVEYRWLRYNHRYEFGLYYGLTTTFQFIKVIADYFYAMHYVQLSDTVTLMLLLPICD